MEISIADAAAAVQVQMNNELSVQTPIANTTAAGVSGTPASAGVCSDGMTEHFQYLLPQEEACRIENRSLASTSNTDCDSDMYSSDGVPTECVVDVVQQVTIDWMSV